MAKTSSRRKRTMAAPERRFNWNWFNAAELEQVTIYQLVDLQAMQTTSHVADTRERAEAIAKRLSDVPGLYRAVERRAVLLPSE